MAPRNGEKLGSDSQPHPAGRSLKQIGLLCWSPGLSFPKIQPLGKPGSQDGVQLLTENPGLLQPWGPAELLLPPHTEVIEVLWSKLKTPEKLLTTKPPQSIHAELLGSHTATASTAGSLQMLESPWP